MKIYEYNDRCIDDVLTKITKLTVVSGTIKFLSPEMRTIIIPSETILMGYPDYLSSVLL